MIQSVQVIIYGNQNHNCLNEIEAVQLTVGKQLLISTSLINPFETSVIDQHVRESTNLVGFYHFFPRAELRSFNCFLFSWNSKGTQFQLWNSRLSQNKMKRLLVTYLCFDQGALERFSRHPLFHPGAPRGNQNLISKHFASVSKNISHEPLQATVVT